MIAPVGFLWTGDELPDGTTVTVTVTVVAALKEAVEVVEALKVIPCKKKEK